MEEIFSISRVRKVAAAYHNYTTKSKFLTESYKRHRIFIEHVEGFINFLNVNLIHEKVEEAHFTICNDKIYMPYKCYFKRLVGVTREQNYYSTLFHELTHWTGHRKRLKRKSLVMYNTDVKSKTYDAQLCALEEVTAELGANMLMEFLELQKNPSYQSLGLINKELSAFDKETQEKIYAKASKQANRAFMYLVKQYSKYIREQKRLLKSELE